jgi:hypothetical protein
MTEQPPLVPDQKKQDAEHLKLLSIFHFVMAGLSAIGMGFLFLHYTLMHLVFANPEIWKNQKGGPSPALFFEIFRWFYLVFGIIILIFGIGNLLSALFIRRRRNRMFSLIMAGINCIQIPFGTALGVFTIIVLLRESVRETYEKT